MSEFIQLHMLVSYPPSNLNRDDMGQPKTAYMGGKERLRISSQSLKRAWRTSDLFFGGNGIRTRELGSKIEESLTSGKDLYDLLFDSKNAETKYSPIIEDDAKIWSLVIMNALGKVDAKEKGSDNSGLEDDDFSDDEDENTDAKGKKAGKSGQKNLRLKQLIHLSRDEVRNIADLLKEISKYENKENPEESLNDIYLFKEQTKGGIKKKKGDKSISEKNVNKQLHGKILRTKDSAIDIAMFGRMLTSAPEFNREAAVQVSHSISVDAAVIEEDYFTAVDDLNTGNQGSGHINEASFASGIFYTYICINRSLLKDNLSDYPELVGKSLNALVETATKVSPSGKQNSFASREFALYVIAEKGTQQPRSLSVAFLKPVSGNDRLTEAVKKLEDVYVKMEDAYGKCSDETIRFDVLGVSDKGNSISKDRLPKIVSNLSDLKKFVSE